MKTNNFFISGKISVLLDASFGSSGKGKIASYLIKNANNVSFLCATNSPNASHTVIDGDKKMVFKCLPSASYLHENLDAIYIGQGASLDKSALLKEIELIGLPPHKLIIDSNTAIVSQSDIDYEKGVCDLGGCTCKKSDGTMKSGTTASGSGACRARKILRKPDTVLVKNDPDLCKFAASDVPIQIMNRLSKGESGFLEIGQGFPLSVGYKMYPYVTSRNVTVTAGLDDMMLPVTVIGNVCLNLRTFPIRIHSFKYIGTDGKHLTWDEVQSGIPCTKIDSYSGPFYEDQVEISWEDMKRESGYSEFIAETTTLTKLPRRIATFSKQNLVDAILYNQTPNRIFLSVNFINYIDWKMQGIRDKEMTSKKVDKWLNHNIYSVVSKFDNVKLAYLGTGYNTDEVINV